MQTNRSLIKTHTLSLRSIFQPDFILNYFRRNNIYYYVYEIRYLGCVLKYGYSVAEPGERLYRQIANIPLGWNKNYRSPSGKDFRCVCDDFKEKHGVDIDKNNVEIVIHDMTHYDFEIADTPLLEIRRFEAELINDFIRLHGTKPIGNIKAERHALWIKRTSDKMMETFFIT